MDQRIGECRPYRAKMSPTACRNNRGINREGCRGCEGLKNITTTPKPKPTAAPAPKPAPPAAPAPAASGPGLYRDALMAAMQNKGYTVSMLANATSLPIRSIYNWLQGKSRTAIHSARIIDQALGSNLAEEYQDQLREMGKRMTGRPVKARSAATPEPAPAAADPVPIHELYAECHDALRAIKAYGEMSKEEREQIFAEMNRNFAQFCEMAAAALRAAANESDFGRRNFAPSNYRNSQNKSQEQYLLTRDGFTLLAMRFTGPQAVAWQIRYIDAFNAMEKKLSAQAAPALPPPDNRDAVNMFLTGPVGEALAKYLIRQGLHLARRLTPGRRRLIKRAAFYAGLKSTNGLGLNHAWIGPASAPPANPGGGHE